MECFVQKFKRTLSPKERVKRYYIVLTAFNDIHLSSQQLELLVFIVEKKLLTTETRREFAALHNTTTGTVDNLVSRLKKLGMLEDTSEGLAINPYAMPPIDRTIQLQIELNGETIHKGSDGLPYFPDSRGDQVATAAVQQSGYVGV